MFEDPFVFRSEERSHEENHLRPGELHVFIDHVDLEAHSAIDATSKPGERKTIALGV